MTVASLITTVGLMISLIGVSRHWPECLVFGLACDVMDGRVARWMDEVTDFGGRLDWYADVIVCHALLFSIGAWGVIVPVAVWQAYARGEAIRFSGRAAVTMVACGMWWMGVW